MTIDSDYISRQAALDLCERFDGCVPYSVLSNYDMLPSVSTEKTGRWIKHDTGHSIYYDCSLCGCAAPCTETADKILWKLANYCPDCGAKMVEPQERGGDKECQHMNYI